MFNIGFFFVVWGIIIVLNQVLFYGACFKMYCLSSALPHTGLLTVAFFIYVKLSANKRQEQEETEEQTNYCIECGTKYKESNKDNLSLLINWANEKGISNYSYRNYYLDDLVEVYINKIKKILYEKNIDEMGMQRIVSSRAFKISCQSPTVT